MRNLTNAKVLLAGLAAAFCFSACQKGHNPEVAFDINQTNLVADSAGFGASRIDKNLANAWGIALSPAGGLWISANHLGTSVVYDKTGQTLIPPVTIPSTTPGQPGAPTGVIFNSTSDFAGSHFIFASEDGIIAAWTSGSSAATVADRSAFNAVYKGIAMATDGGANFLYLANFKGAKIDVFDKNFTYITTKPFIDPGIIAGFAPFNIKNIGGKLYVTYAKQKAPDNHDDLKGPGNGYVDIFNPDGTFVKRFASQGTLNSPWGIALAPAGFTGFLPKILIGNFGDGHINVFDLLGNYKGQLQNKGQAIAIDGLWAIDFLKGDLPGGDPGNPLYFTAGPIGESHGLFGTLQKR